jgi:hypothetical protein
MDQRQSDTISSCGHADHSVVCDEPLYFNLGFPEIDKEANADAGGFEIVEALGGVNFLEALYRLQFDDDASFHE